MESPLLAPGPVRELRALNHPSGVVLAWDPPAEAGPEATKYYVVRLRMERNPRVETTRFLGLSRRTLDEEGLPPGQYRFLVGALGPTGSSPSVAVDVSVKET